LALTRSDIAASAEHLLADGYRLLLVSNGAVLEQLEANPFELPVTSLDFLAEHDEAWDVADLMRVYNTLNATAFGEKGIPLQDWVMLDLGLMPSAFVLITLPADRAAAAATDTRFGDAHRARVENVLAPVLAQARRLGYDGPIPVAGYCAAPTPVPGSWVGWSLCSAIPGLGTTAKGLALEVYGARTLTGVTQFYDPALHVHRKFGRMRVLAAVVKLHTVANTLIYCTDVYAHDDGQSPTSMMDCRDAAAQRQLQAKIDAGVAKVYVLSPGLVDDQVPILETS
jgi:hypothetical protein